MPARKGEQWNESETWRDAWTLRACRRLTTLGEVNQTPNYHTNIGFTADSEFLVFWTLRENRGAFCKVEVATGEITQLTEAVADYGFCVHIQGGPYPRMCLAPNSRWLVHTGERSLHAVHLDTLEERVLIADTGPWELGYPSVSGDESQVLLPLSTLHPEIAAGTRVTRHYFDHFADGQGMQLRLASLPLTGGAVSDLWREDGCRSFHAEYSPTDNDLLLLDRDFPPRYWSGGDGRTTRIWSLRPDSNTLTELAARNRNCDHTHAVWSFDGERVLYHGRNRREGGWILGVCTPWGEVLREYDMTDAPHYGHVSAMAGREALLLDGNVSDNLLVWLYFDADLPRFEVIAGHNTEWGSLPGQTTHPHPLCSPDGRWISFNTTQKGRSDVAVVRV
ncbi:MAG: oligogalacturonate lyase family protein [Anaerolineaceae bacterium]|nr:oligogalacturonate lyase family protein [Anaerolineaceae bacterium]